MQGRLDAAHATIAELSLQLGEARAQLASAAELREMAVKNAALEAKQAMQADTGALYVERQLLRERIRQLEAQWEEWRDSEAQPQGAPPSPPGAAPAPEAPAPAGGAATGPDAPGVDPLLDVRA